MSHTPLTSKADFDAALETKGKYVLIYAYTGEVSPQAEAAAKEFSATTAPFKVDVDKFETAKKYFNITKTPTVVVFKDGKEVKKVEGMDQEGMKAVKQMLTA